MASGSRGSVASLAWLGEGDRVLFSATHYGYISLWDTRDQRILWEGGPDSMGALRDKKSVMIIFQLRDTDEIIVKEI